MSLGAIAEACLSSCLAQRVTSGSPRLLSYSPDSFKDESVRSDKRNIVKLLVPSSLSRTVISGALAREPNAALVSAFVHSGESATCSAFLTRESVEPEHPQKANMLKVMRAVRAAIIKFLFFCRRHAQWTAGAQPQRVHCSSLVRSLLSFIRR